MSEQLELGRELRDEAVARVDRNAERNWKTTADFCAETIARYRARFTSEDILDAIEKTIAKIPDVGLVATHDLRAMGPVMMRLKKKKLAVPTPDFVQSNRSGRHAGPVRVWRSLVVDGEQRVL